MAVRKGVPVRGMGRGSRILLLLIILVSFIVGYGVYEYLYSQKVTVYVYNSNYDEGTVISKEMFGSTVIEARLYNALKGTGNHYVSAAEIVDAAERGDCLLVKVAENTMATDNQFVSSGGTPIESRLMEDRVSVELPIEKVGGLTAGVRIGSRINIIDGYQIDSTKNADLLFQNLLVVDVVTGPDGLTESVYVEVEPKQSVQLIHAIMFDNVVASIVKPGNYSTVDTTSAHYSRNYDEGVNTNLTTQSGVSFGMTGDGEVR